MSSLLKVVDFRDGSLMGEINGEPRKDQGGDSLDFCLRTLQSLGEEYSVNRLRVQNIAYVWRCTPFILALGGRGRGSL